MTRSEFLKMIGLGGVAAWLAKPVKAQESWPIKYEDPSEVVDLFGTGVTEISQPIEFLRDSNDCVIGCMPGPIVQRRYGLMRGNKVYAQDRVNDGPWSEPFEVPSERVGFSLDMMLK